MKSPNWFAAELARTLECAAVVVAGVHLRPARPADLARLFENARRAVEAIVTQVEPAAQESGRVTGADGSGDQGRRTPAGGGRKQA